MEANHVAGVLEPSRVASHFLEDPLPPLSLSTENSLGKEIPVDRVPKKGRAIGLSLVPSLIHLAHHRPE